jgi:hypothetical protein
MEDVVMVGYPIGSIDMVNNLPLFRKGITATHPGIDFNGQPYGMIDIAAFPGSSGSPVAILNQGSYSSPGGITLGSRFYFLGVLFQGPVYNLDGTMEIIQVPTGQVSYLKPQMPCHVGIYIKSKTLLDFKRVLPEKSSSGV